jgi:hypothetical protein
LVAAAPTVIISKGKPAVRLVEHGPAKWRVPCDRGDDCLGSLASEVVIPCRAAMPIINMRQRHSIALIGGGASARDARAGMVR